MLWHSFVLLLSIFLLYRSAKILVESTITIAQYLKWREFVVAFFVMAIGSSLPNLFVGISAALHNIPQLSLGDVIGNNVIDLTLVVALAALVGKELTVESRLVQTSALFTVLIAVMPILLIWDGVLGRGDGLALLIIFFVYSWWLFSRRKLFSQVVESPQRRPPLQKLGNFLLGMGKIVLGIFFIILAAEGIVRSISFFTQRFEIPVIVVGIFGVALGNALPDLYFAFVSARKGNTWALIGSLMGAVFVLTTLVLGIVAFINPIEIESISPFVMARIFLVISALFFFIFLKTGHKITKKEGFFLLILYIFFLVAEILAEYIIP